MKIKLARQAGFCFGVRRAMEMAQKAAGENAPPIFTLGPLIHNPQVVEGLAEQGIKARENIEEIEQGTLIIRSHGVSPGILDEARHKGLTLVDATCPFVKQAQDLARCLKEDGYQVVVVGDKEHPEVIGIVGWTGNEAVVVENADEAKNLPHYEKIGIVAQTTQPKENFAAVLKVLQDKADQVKAYNTICHATRERQEAAAEMAKNVDVMIVVGGTNSANTQKLARICRDQGTVTYHIETAAELQPHWFKGVRRIGLTAGASTPDWIIEEVKKTMDEIRAELNEENTNDEIRAEDNALNDNTGNIEVHEEGLPTTGDPVCALPEDKAPAMGEAVVEVNNLQRGDIVEGTVVKVLDDAVLVDIGAKAEGFVPIRELSCCHIGIPSDLIKEGDRICTCVIKEEDSEGRVLLSKRLADAEKAWVELEQAMQENKAVSGTVTEVVKGGILLDVGVRAFMPASLVETAYVEDLSHYIGQKLEAKVIELEKAKGKVVLSRKAILADARAEQRKKVLAEIKEGETREGEVRRLTNFGAFIDLGGIDGLLHVSEMAWHRVNDPSEVVQTGDKIKVQVLAVDQESGKISLGLKQVLPSPWKDIDQKYPVGTVVKGKVARIAPFGAFVELEPGLDGLVPVSHLSSKKVGKPEDVVSVGQEVKAKVISVDPDKGKIGLSLREATKDQDVKAYRDFLSQQDDPGKLTLGDLFGDILRQAKEEK